MNPLKIAYSTIRKEHPLKAASELFVFEWRSRERPKAEKEFEEILNGKKKLKSK